VVAGTATSRGYGEGIEREAGASGFRLLSEVYIITPKTAAVYRSILGGRGDGRHWAAQYGLAKCRPVRTPITTGSAGSAELMSWRCAPLLGRAAVGKCRHGLPIRATPTPMMSWRS